MNTLYYGDNLKILREYIKDETVDLCYLDPPFNSNRNYNVLFKDESGKEADAQITAFEDTWHWSPSAEKTYHELLMQADDVSKMIEAFRGFVGTITREDAAIGVFITLEDASRDMKTEAASAGFYHSDGWHRDFPKMQILTIEDLLSGKEVQMPPNLTTFKQAERIKQNDGQNKLF